MNIKNMKYAIAKVEHLLLVLKRMKDDPQGDTGGSYRTAELVALLAKHPAAVAALRLLDRRGRGHRRGQDELPKKARSAPRANGQLSGEQTVQATPLRASTCA